jgi:hypothetical protein
MNARCSKNRGVTVFDNSVLAVAAVSAPEVTKKVATVILGQFDNLPTEEKDVLLDTFRAWLANKGSVAKAAAAVRSPEHCPTPSAPHRAAHRPVARGA